MVPVVWQSPQEVALNTHHQSLALGKTSCAVGKLQEAPGPEIPIFLQEDSLRPRPQSIRGLEAEEERGLPTTQPRALEYTAWGQAPAVERRTPWLARLEEAPTSHPNSEKPQTEWDISSPKSQRGKEDTPMWLPSMATKPVFNSPPETA